MSIDIIFCYRKELCHFNSKTKRKKRRRKRRRMRNNPNPSRRKGWVQILVLLCSNRFVAWTQNSHFWLFLVYISKSIKIVYSTTGKIICFTSHRLALEVDPWIVLLCCKCFTCPSFTFHLQEWIQTWTRAFYQTEKGRRRSAHFGK